MRWYRTSGGGVFYVCKTAGRGPGRALAAIAMAGGLLLTAATAQRAGADTAAIMGGGPFYSGGASVMNTLRSSGFDTVILWTIHVYYPSGDLIFNNQLVCSGGAYVGATNWPAQLATLKQAPTSVDRIEVCVASGGGPNDFLAIQKLIADQGSGTNSMLYRNFQALVAATGADAICFNDESLYDVATMVTFGQLVDALGCKVTLCPYNNTQVWQNVKSQLGSVVDAVYLQCYAGGAGNNPATWNAYFGGLKVSPGLWCKHGSGCTAGDSASTVATQIAAWKSSAGITGGFMWLFDDMLDCTASTPAQYAAAIAGVVSPAATPIWDGGGTNDAWTTGTNWTGDVAPGAGAVLHFAGTTRLSPSNDFAAGTSFPSIFFDSGAGAFTLSGHPITMSVTIENNSTNEQEVALPIILGTGSTLTLRTLLGSGDLTLSGVISGLGNLEKQVQAVNATTAILSGDNTYSGKTTVLAGNLSIASIKPMGSGLPSSVGMPSPGNGTIALGTASKLIYTGPGDTTDRGIDLTGNPCRITQDGGGLLKFTGDFSVSVSGAKALTLDGAGAGEIAGAIANPPVSGNTRIVKEGVGTWTLSGSNTYRSVTTISAGTLAVTGSGSIAQSPTIEVGTGATLDVARVSSTFTVDTNQTLKGAGIVLGNVAVSGAIDAGSGTTSPALSVQGNVAFNPESSYRVGVGAATGGSVLVSGDVDLGDASLAITGALTSASYVILSCSGALSGTFHGLANNAPIPSTGYAVQYVTGGPPAYVALTKITSPIEYVIHISVDGMHARAPRTLVESGVGTNFARLFNEGSYTERARTDYDSTVTSPNHASIFTGRPTGNWTGKPGHLWGNNDTHPWDRWELTLHAPHTVGSYYGPGPGLVFVYTTAQYYADNGPNKTNYEYVSSVLDVVHDSGKRTCMYYGKDRLSVEAESYGPVHGRLTPNLATNDPAVNKVDASLYCGPFDVTTNWLPAMVANPFHYSFLHFSLPDDRGHSFTWSFTNAWRAELTNFVSSWNTNTSRYVPASYMGAIQQVDIYLGQVFSLIETNAALSGKTAIVLTTDHGGLLGAFDHGFVTQPDCFQIDVFAWGPGIPAGGDLYALNRQYTDPGPTNRPDFNNPNQPIRNGDTGNLALSLLGLGAIPGSTLNVSQSLGAVDTDGDGLSDNYERSIFTDPYIGDTDADGARDGDELSAGTSPTNAASIFEITGVDVALSAEGALVTWSSESNRLYTLWCSSNLLEGFTMLSNNIAATPAFNTFTNRMDGAGQMHYSISVQP